MGAVGGIGRELALFDFDGTLLAGDSIVAYMRWARRNRLIGLGEFLYVCAGSIGFTMGLVSSEDSKTRALRFRQDFPPESREDMDRRFVREELLPRVYKSARDALRRHAGEGRICLLVTASTENYMRYVSEALGFHALLATPVDENGVVRDNCRGEEKIKRIRQWMEENGIEADLSASYAYGDSKSDLPMLLLCGHPVQVNPKRALRRAAPDMPVEHWK